ncbi:MAG: hypothetical protein K1W06_00495 [Lachnospiraceae bacterium]
MKNMKILIILPVTMLLISSRITVSPADAIANSIQDAVSQDNIMEREAVPRETSFPPDTVLPQNTLQPAQTPAVTPTLKPASSSVPYLLYQGQKKHSSLVFQKYQMSIKR